MGSAWWLFFSKSVGEGEDQNIICYKIWIYGIQKKRIEKLNQHKKL